MKKKEKKIPSNTLNMNKLDIEKGFYQVDLKGMSALQLAGFLSPFIEHAGFEWEIRESFTQTILTITTNCD